MELVAEDMVATVPTGFANADVYRGREGFMRMAEQWLEPWSEFRSEPLELVEEGDAVIVSVHQSGTGARAASRSTWTSRTCCASATGCWPSGGSARTPPRRSSLRAAGSD